MIKYLLISVRSEWVYHILNGDKTIELRKVIPNWVLESVAKGETVKCLIYCTKAKPYLSTELQLFNIPQFDDRLDLNGKIVAQFDLNMIEEMTIEVHQDSYFEDEFEYNFTTEMLIHHDSLEMSNVAEIDFVNYEPKYAMYIDNLKMFDKPKNLSDYYKYVTKTIYCGLDCPPYDDEVKVPLTKAPQNMMTVWGIDE